MNLTWAAAAIILILLGGISGFYIVSILGVFVLIAALIVPSKTTAKPQPTTQSKAQTPTRAPSPRAAPPPQAQAQTPPQPMPQPVQSMIYSQAANQGYTSTMALFPMSMFPPLSPAAMPVQVQEQRRPAEIAESRDELVEMVAVLALLKLLSV